ncbi:hypothetical protein A5906_15145 [Bradyrhizobium sacchari]|uniref:O-antigen/teichoic acid export membrane protein n=1 Tax=Bradyrhizobium sacchari TaxID=1399419 RepID=A0A560JIE6_9BRAD|nr:hypothetical protein [Bradyrhizobium sacchari]OPY94026.1 hypothetical protein A5906_15145 [Bradyrhizobium sacchari]TWB49280.1 O-antigen/teichoic acid export membrane protein [Bradyrhizobium sacchari]TWB68110.1 O-antigen/teichoic acid export membrane protein [Bradyrhizobium sacchari]
MIRLLALGSYFYQSLVAILLILLLSHQLEAAHYTTYSLTMAVSQFATVVAFEWIQLAGQRFLASSGGDDTKRLQCSLFLALALSAAALAAIAALAAASGLVPLSLIGLGFVVTIMQGTTDLHYMMIRVSGKLSWASILLICRATFLLAGAATGAGLYGTTEAALLGIFVGHGLGLVLGSIVDRTFLNWSPRIATRADLSAFARYGMLASGASVVHLSVPILIRFLVVGRFGIASSASAGFSMAIDLLQRPFSVLLSAIHTISYPDVVARFDNDTRKAAQTAAAGLFDLAVCSTALMLGGLVAFIPDAARFFVPPALIASFLAVTPTVALFYFLHTHLQATLALVPHLEKAALRLIIIAAGQLALVSIFVLASTAASLGPTAAIALAGLATALVIACSIGPTVRFGAYPRPMLAFSSVLGATIIAASVALPSEPVSWLLAKIAAAALITIAIGWVGDLLKH